MAVQVPLKILITDPTILDHPDIDGQVDKLIKAGHDVTVDAALLQYDFICGPNCWLLRPEVAGLFTMAVTNARKVANADQKRADAHSAAKSSKKPAARAGKASSRSTKVKESPAVEQHNLPAGQQLDFTTDPEADSFSAGC
jgi:hypothetical protein